MKKARINIPLFFLLLPALIFPAPQVKEKDLPQQYRDWLKLTSYIILPAERDVFFKLGNDRERDIFIESFWKQRDPTPGTPQNEYKEEHIKRFNHANEYYRRGTPREGWMTDMGRVYITLGEPNSIERFEGTPGIYPSQVWYYYGDRTKGLPTYFALVFYQRGGAGEFKLYNPTSDGPLSLIIDTRNIDVTKPEKIYEKIKELAPTLADVTISLIPGQFPYNFQPSPQSNIILADILESPKKNISSSYATHFLSYKGIVSTEYLTNYIENASTVALVREPLLGAYFCHFAVSPKKVSLDYYQPKDQYYCNFKVDVSLRAGQKIILQYSKDFPVYFPPDKIDIVKAKGITLQDFFPVIEGQYKLTVLLQNAVGKEFTIAEKEIVIGGGGESPQIIGPVLGYDLQSFPSQVQTPFKFMDQQLQVDPNETLSPKDEVAFFFSLMNLTESIWKEGEVAVLISGLKEKDPQKKNMTLSLKDYPYQKTLGLARAFPAGELTPDYYEIRLLLKKGNGETVAEAKSQFIISPQEVLPHPVTVSKSFPLANIFIFYYTLAQQYEQVNEPAMAEANFEKALLLKPDFQEGVVGFANFLLKTGKFDRSLETIERVKGEVKLDFDYFLIKGQAFEGKGEYTQAVESLLEANRIYNSDTRLLNSLGFCYYKTGQKKEALDALNASLRLNPEQKEIKDLIARIGGELK